MILPLQDESFEATIDDAENISSNRKLKENISYTVETNLMSSNSFMK